MNHRFVLTGGPGAGKTSLLGELAAKGFTCTPESARPIIRARLSTGLSPRPVPIEFARAVLAADINAYQRCQAESSPCFFDRGIMDALYMMDAADGMSAEQLTSYINKYPYNTNVFLLPPWQEIYQGDDERDQTYLESIAVYEGMRAWYLKHGYRIVELPKLPLNERLSFVLETVSVALSK